MSEINSIANLENANKYSVNAGKKSSEIVSDFSTYLGKTKTLDELFEQASEKYKISEELLKAVGKAESNFDSNAVSRCGAQGIMQLMPATAKELGVSDSFNAEQNIMGGAKYLSGLLKKYDGNTKLALAAYNAGSGNVAKYGGIPPFTETQNYVKKVISYMDQGVNTAGVTVVTGDSGKQINADTSNTISTTRNVPASNSATYIYPNGPFRTTSELQDLDTTFSYDDYLKFIALLMEEENDSKSENSEENKMRYPVQEINYNVTIMNLLKDQKIME